LPENPGANLKPEFFSPVEIKPANGPAFNGIDFFRGAVQF
jgi:hypothetical protein